MAEYGREKGPAFEAMHPGELLRETILPALKEQRINQSDLARMLAISRQSLSDIVNEKRSVTAEMAVRLGTVFDNSPAFWLNLQSNYDLWHAEREVDVTKLGRVA